MSPRSAPRGTRRAGGRPKPRASFRTLRKPNAGARDERTPGGSARRRAVVSGFHAFAWRSPRCIRFFAAVSERGGSCPLPAAPARKPRRRATILELGGEAALPARTRRNRDARAEGCVLFAEACSFPEIRTGVGGSCRNLAVARQDRGRLNQSERSRRDPGEPDRRRGIRMRSAGCRRDARGPGRNARDLTERARFREDAMDPGRTWAILSAGAGGGEDSPHRDGCPRFPPESSASGRLREMPTGTSAARAERRKLRWNHAISDRIHALPAKSPRSRRRPPDPDGPRPPPSREGAPQRFSSAARRMESRSASATPGRMPCWISG